MATYTLIPSSLTGGREISNASNSYTDTNSDTYATITLTNTYNANLGGFDRSAIPSGKGLAVSEVRLKVQNLYTVEATAQVMSAPDGVALSNSVEISKSASIITFTLNEAPTIIAQYLDTLCIHFSAGISGAQYLYIYGADITVTTAEYYNKVIYDGDTIIDLTGDTATASDVLSGKTFHLANGFQATGALSPSPSSVTIDTTTASPTLRKLTCSGLTKEPSWFVLIFYASNGSNTGRTKRIMHALYDGTTLATWSVNSTEGAVNRYTDRCSFSYSSGTLTLTIQNSTNYPYFGQGTWQLYYL